MILRKGKIIRILVLLTIILIFTKCYSEEITSKGTKKYYSEIGFGLSIPTSYFGMNCSSDNSYGSANTGSCIYVSYGYRSEKNIGFKFALSVNSYSANEMIDTTFMNIALYPDVELVTEVGRWTNISLLLGPTFSHTKNNSIFNISVLAGIIIANRPSIGHNFYRNDKLTWVYYVSSGKGVGICIRPEITYTYMLSGKLGIEAYLSYSYSRPQLEYKKEYPRGITNWQFRDVTINQTITNIDFGLKLVVKMK